MNKNTVSGRSIKTNRKSQEIKKHSNQGIILLQPITNTNNDDYIENTAFHKKQ